MQSRQKYIVVSVAALMILVSMVCAHALQWFWGYMGWNDPFVWGIRELPLSASLGYMVGLTGLIVCLLNLRIRTLGTEVIDELSRVSWPERDKTVLSTVSVVVTVVVCSVYLGVLDALWLWLTGLMLNA